ncbi:signal peptide peptidase [Legionella quinlivanii]|uniref:Signal peptide peptidase n=1 Tax=Legionella quinlivanii TaxID=45073 RepID=A0A0W0XWR7_9GAMM|nr:S49 family peptidase [Legionella quinlivanii]KTD49144.1 signal peptide peptidase [Legionella quinlivanii]SEG43067.1 protease-4 [Legionella quinlivanii DSM 21216]STY11654.1 signal peptide peptidase [Legionella quinlivanii]
MNNPSVENSADSQVLLNQIVIEFMKEQKRKRRWRWVWRILFLLLIVWIVYEAAWDTEEKGAGSKPHVGLIDVNGSIFDTQSNNAENFAKGLDAAYKNKGLKALILRINSPGGSPVQASYMYNSLKYYRSKYPDIKVYAVCVDICASAAYYVAVGADEIYADESSLVGSIGVLYNGFGFVDAMQKLGITRRLQTAGNNKGILDPFSPITPEQTQLMQTMLDDIHQQFIAKVKEGRGTRLLIDDQTFSGLFWTGTQAKQRGLIDGIASSGQLARDTIKIDTVSDYTYKQSVFEKVSKNIGTAMADQLPLALGLNTGLR